MGPGTKVVRWLSFLAIIAAAFNLRAGIASVGPVLGDILSWYEASGALAGLITAMPGLFFAIMGLAAVPMARRIGLSRALLLGMFATTVGLGLRPWVSSVWIFLLLTGFVVAGIAVSNVLLPAWIKLHGGKNTVTLMTLNTSILGLSGSIGPLSAALAEGPGGWRDALFIWVWISLAQVVVWAVVALKKGYDFPSYQAHAKGPSLLRSPAAVALMLYFGLQSMHAYVQMGWLPQMLLDRGTSLAEAAWALSIVGGLGVVGGIIMPTVVARSRHLPAYPVLFGALACGGYLGIYLAPTVAPLLWAVILGLGGWAFPTALNLIVAKSQSPLIAARLSGFVQPVGYIIAAAGPFLIGLVYQPGQNWTVILFVLMLAAVLKGAVGFVAARPGSVDEELRL